MGNRAHIQVAGAAASIYLHWTGSPDQVLAVIDTARERDLLGHDPDYTTATLLALFRVDLGVNGKLSLGIAEPFNVDAPAWVEFDNGLYVLNTRGELLSRWVYSRDLNAEHTPWEMTGAALGLDFVRGQDSYKTRRARLAWRMDRASEEMPPEQLELALGVAA